MAQSDADYAFIEEMRDWFYSFTNYIESEDEENDSHMLWYALVL